ncbi:hypothetical protein DPMN_094429 [Dreissena polymorpha]|uniref:Uncharacterized protein n=1 Tax=Dreissena polymorpha TaxID=45954 RepID=A0A9D4R2V2_DREPO|nr:hypothetical protein DPMN_094429 [Dreissena polymorpha]
MCCLSIPSHRSPEDVIGIEKQLERLLAFRDCLCAGETPEETTILIMSGCRVPGERPNLPCSHPL